MAAFERCCQAISEGSVGLSNSVGRSVVRAPWRATQRGTPRTQYSRRPLSSLYKIGSRLDLLFAVEKVEPGAAQGVGASLPSSLRCPRRLGAVLLVRLTLRE